MKIELIDHSRFCGKRHVFRYIRRYLSIVPKKDLLGIVNIRLYDNPPRELGYQVSGGYVVNDEGAEIHFYLGPLLGFMDEFSAARRGARFMDRIFLVLFGKVFIANNLFHEIGHHKCEMTTSRKKSKHDEFEEQKATEYANDLLSRAFPISQRYYALYNSLYHCLYRRRIEMAEKRQAPEEVRKD